MPLLAGTMLDDRSAAEPGTLTRLFQGSVTIRRNGLGDLRSVGDNELE
jgi:hypothetical protein